MSATKKDGSLTYTIQGIPNPKGCILLDNDKPQPLQLTIFNHTTDALTFDDSSFIKLDFKGLLSDAIVGSTKAAKNFPKGWSVSTPKTGAHAIIKISAAATGASSIPKGKVLSIPLDITIPAQSKAKIGNIGIDFCYLQGFPTSAPSINLPLTIQGEAPPMDGLAATMQLTVASGYSTFYATPPAYKNDPLANTMIFQLTAMETLYCQSNDTGITLTFNSGTAGKTGTPAINALASLNSIEKFEANITSDNNILYGISSDGEGNFNLSLKSGAEEKEVFIHDGDTLRFEFSNMVSFLPSTAIGIPTPLTLNYTAFQNKEGKKYINDIGGLEFLKVSLPLLTASVDSDDETINIVPYTPKTPFKMAYEFDSIWGVKSIKMRVNGLPKKGRNISSKTGIYAASYLYDWSDGSVRPDQVTINLNFKPNGLSTDPKWKGFQQQQTIPIAAFISVPYILPALEMNEAIIEFKTTGNGYLFFITSKGRFGQCNLSTRAIDSSGGPWATNTGMVSSADPKGTTVYTYSTDSFEHFLRHATVPSLPSKQFSLSPAISNPPTHPLILPKEPDGDRVLVLCDGNYVKYYYLKGDKFDLITSVAPHKGMGNISVLRASWVLPLDDTSSTLLSVISNGKLYGKVINRTGETSWFSPKNKGGVGNLKGAEIINHCFKFEGPAINSNYAMCILGYKAKAIYAWYFTMGTANYFYMIGDQPIWKLDGDDDEWIRDLKLSTKIVSTTGHDSNSILVKAIVLTERGLPPYHNAYCLGISVSVETKSSPSFSVSCQSFQQVSLPKSGMSAVTQPGTNNFAILGEDDNTFYVVEA